MNEPTPIEGERTTQHRVNIVGTIEIALAVLLFVLLLFPWVNVPAYGNTYGYELPTALRSFDKLDGNLKGIDKGSFNPFLLIYLLPIFVIALIVRQARHVQAHTLACAAGAVPIASIAYALGVAGTAVFPLLMPAAWVAMVSCVLLGSAALVGIHVGYDHDRALRARMAFGVLAAATPICYVIGWLNS